MVMLLGAPCNENPAASGTFEWFDALSMVEGTRDKQFLETRPKLTEKGIDK